MDTVTAIVIPVVTAVCTIASFLIGRQTAARKQGKEEGEIKSDIEYIKQRIDRLVANEDSIFSRINKNNERITRTEEKLEDTIRRLDRWERRKE